MIKKVFNFKYNKFNPSVNEWHNSIYTFDKNNLNTLFSNKLVFDIFNAYFNIKPRNTSILKKINKKFKLKRIFVGIPEIKNSLNKINILVYVFNKEKLVLDKKIKELKKINKGKNYKSLSNNNKLSLNFTNNRFKLFNNLFNDSYEIISNFCKKIYNINFIKHLNISSFLYNKNLYKNTLVKNNNFFKIMKNKLNDTHNILIEKYYVLFFYKRYITRIYFNKLKFNSINLLNLNKLFYKLYNKNIVINIINLKYLYLDNSIYIDAIVRKLKIRKSKVLRVLRKALILPKIPKIEPMYLLEKEKEIKNIFYNIIGFYKFNNIKKIVIESLKNIHVIGMRLEGKGRLTKKLTASRSTHKKAYKGSLKNIYSSIKGLSALNTKGFNRSNLNYVNLNSYNRNGSYGVKSWQNTM